MTVAFGLDAVDATGARAGTLRTAHGVVPTPVFMAVGTQATVKTLGPDDLEDLRAPIILANTYHLYLRPGTAVIDQFEGVHRFMGWNGPLLTDSGGFQVFSLAHRRTIDEDGVTFRSHLDGSAHRFTPQSAMEIQRSLGADIVMAFDECIDARADERYVRESTARTHRWAAICRDVPLRDHQSAFGIVQGGLSEEMRRWSAQELTALDFPGYAIGGLSVGEEKSLTYSMAAVACEELPAHKARYLMGVGSPEDFVEAVAVGVDMFDCVLPTRVARNGGFLTRNGRLNVFNARFARQEDSIDPECQCPTCSRFSAAYLHHLFRAKEILGLRLATLHNLHFMFELARDARSAIVKGRYAAFLAEFRDRYRLSDQAVRATQKERWLARRAAVKGS